MAVKIWPLSGKLYLPCRARAMDASMISEMKAMAKENRRLKRMYAEMSMQNDVLKEALEKKNPFTAQKYGTMGS